MRQDSLISSSTKGCQSAGSAATLYNANCRTTISGTSPCDGSID